MMKVTIVKKGEVDYGFFHYQEYLLLDKQWKSMKTFTLREFERWQQSNNLTGYWVRVDFFK